MNQQLTIQDELEKLYTIDEVADYLKMSRSTVKKYIREGVIEAIKFGKTKQAAVRISHSELERFVTVQERV